MRTTTRVRTASRGRLAVSATAAALLLGVAAATSVSAAPALVRGPAALADWNGGYPGWSGGSGSGSDSGGGYGAVGDGGSALSDGTDSSTVDSQPATAAQSAGVVLIDIVLGYQNAEAAGTGIILTSDGQILTNYHVVEGSSQISVTDATTGKTYQATVVGSDKSADVALLQLSGASDLRTATLDDDQAAVGDTVTAVGNAGGTGSLSAASGKITALDASLTAGSEGSGGSETLHGMIETSADVVAGDSGGPLFDAEGEVVGIDTAASTGGDIDGYAIPIDTALTVVDQIRSGSESSTVRIGPAAFLGVQVGSDDTGFGATLQDPYGNSSGNQDGSNSEAQYGAQGATIAGVVSGSAAAQAGLSAGDVITSIDRKAVASADDVSQALAGANPGDQVTVTWADQAGEQHSSTVTLGESPVA